MDSTLDAYRLPTDVTPTHYDLKIRTDLVGLSFDGAVQITLLFITDTSSLTFNAFEIQLGTIFIVSGTDTLTPQSQAIDIVTQRVTLSFAKTFARGSTAVLHLTFRGKLSNTGFITSDWEHDGVKEHYSVSFLEPTFARRVFPCWDEPLLKATFAVSLISRKGTVNLSNMPSFSEGPYDPLQDALEPTFKPTDISSEWIITRFETTPKMSTYIVAFASGPFAHLESSFTSPLTERVCPLRIYTMPDCINQAQFSLDLMAKVVPMLETMFDMEYPLPKLDLLTVSGALGVLENWGLILGSPDAILFDPARDSTSTKKRVVSVVAHELAHQWFGNIVTMAWWDNLWLNEGFATLLGGLIAGLLYPEWNGPAARVNGILKVALNMDAKTSSHPIQVDCPDANHITEIFDSISYMKSSAILDMLMTLLGEELFLKGVSLYLKENKWGNTVANDLWSALGRASGMDVVNLMDRWTLKTGYPVVTVTEAPGGINVRQNRFLASGVVEAAADETIWTIPLNILTGIPAETIDKTVFLSEREMFIPLDTSIPFKLNRSNTGFYRVLYTSERLNKLAIAATKQSVGDRVGIMNDAMALATANLAKLSSALTLIEGLIGETEYLVLQGIGANINGLLATWWENEAVSSLLKTLDREIFVPLVAQLGYTYHADESTDTAAARTLAIQEAANSGDPAVISELRARFAKFTQTGDDSNIPPDLISIVYNIAVHHGGREEYDRMWKILKTTKSPAVEGYAAVAIGAAEDPVLVAETLNHLLQESDGNFDWLLAGLTGNSKSRRAVVPFFKAHFEEIEKRFAGNGFEHYCQMPFRRFTSEQDYQETVEFFKTKDTSKYARSLEQTLESIRANINTLERSTKEITEWLEAWQSRRKQSV
ncbi:leucyl aminopeptidase [Mycena rebaudengoi]|nr:leucyl aminopeptidase [Mycena rebaudengoi]